MFPNISVVQLRCFRAVAEQGRFTAAADHLCLSQSAVSQAVAGLEKTLNAALLTRGRDGVTLTAAGIAALAEVRQALAAIDAPMEAELARRTGRTIRRAPGERLALHAGFAQAIAP